MSRPTKPAAETGPSPSALTEDAWRELRSLTPARIALGRAGASLPTREVLAFSLAHAQARDAVHAALDVDALLAQLSGEEAEPIVVRSKAADRAAYLARPDWGRRLDSDDASGLVRAATGPCDIAWVISDGLSATAVQRHAVPLLTAVRPLLGSLRCAPVVIATQARVALADEVGAALQARVAVSLIGERPGLSSPDSLGLYITWNPRPGTTDEARNCISNVRPLGLAIPAAAQLLAALLRAVLQQQLSGVALRFDPARAIGAQ